MPAPNNDKRIDRSFLGDAATRLGRALDLSGPIGPEFDAGVSLQPQVLVVDATGPGFVAQRGRRFVQGQVGISPNGPLFVARPGGPGVIVDRVVLAVELLANTVQMRWINQLTTPTGNFGAIIERSVANELPPLLTDTSAGVGVFAGAVAMAVNTSIVIPIEAYFSAGSGLQFFPGAVGSNVTITVFGKLF